MTEKSQGVAGEITASRYFLQTEFDDEPTYIFEGEVASEDDALVTVAPGNADLARAILDFLNTYFVRTRG